MTLIAAGHAHTRKYLGGIFSKRLRVCDSSITDVTVDWGLVDHIVIPYDRIDTLHEAESSPTLVRTVEVPIEGNGTHHETDEGENGIASLGRDTSGVEV